MANQPKKYKKFVATAATATLVASAIVPVASAAGFTDVKGNSHEEAINALADAGIINGYADGTFKPNQTINRGQVVKLLGRWLESEGYEAPADWDTKQRFNDLPLTAEKELVKYAALAKDAGVFAGSNGNLNYTQTMQRQQMAVVLVRAINEIYDLDLVKEYKAEKFKSEISDLDKAFSAEQREAITALEYAELTNAATLPGKAFNPANSITRGQFASFLYRTINIDATTPVDASVKAINNTTVEVTFDEEQDNVDGLKFEIKDLKVVNAAVKQTNKKVVVLTTEAQTADKEYTVSLNAEEIGKFKGIGAVVPTAVNVTTTSVQGVVGQQVTLKAEVKVAEGQAKAGIPVTFNVDPYDALNSEQKSSLNKSQVVEVKTDDNGVATYTYTQYNAGQDQVVAYATGNPANRSFAKVYWGVKPILTLTSKEGTTLENGKAKTYTATYVDPVTGTPMKNQELKVTFKENIDESVTNDTNAVATDAATGATVKPFESKTDQRVLLVKTNDKGEATFTVTGSNTAVTPIVYKDSDRLNTSGWDRLDARDLQAVAEETKFVGGAYTFKFNKEQQFEAVVGKPFTYELEVLKADGKPYAGGTVTVALNELIDGSITTNTEAYIVNNDKVKPIAGKAGVFTLELDKDGKAKFDVRADKTEVSATPVVWVDINSASNIQGTLEKEESFKLAGSVVFRNEVIAGAELEDTSDVTGIFGVTGTGLQQPNYEITLLDQAGKEYSKNDFAIDRVTYTISNTGNSAVDLTLAPTNFTVDNISNHTGSNNQVRIAAGQSVTVTGKANVGVNPKKIALQLQNATAGKLNVVGSVTTVKNVNGQWSTNNSYYSAGTATSEWVEATPAATEVTGVVKGYQTVDGAADWGHALVLVDGTSKYQIVRYDQNNTYFTGTQTDFNRLTATNVAGFETAISLEDRISLKNTELRLINVDSSSKSKQVAGNNDSTGGTGTGVVNQTVVNNVNASANQNAVKNALQGIVGFSNLLTVDQDEIARVVFGTLTSQQTIASLTNTLGTSVTVASERADSAKALKAAIDAAQAKHDSAVEGSALGQYAPGSKNTLQGVITTAKAQYDAAITTHTTPTKATLDTQKGLVNSAVTTFEAGKVTTGDVQTAALNAVKAKLVDVYNAGTPLATGDAKFAAATAALDANKAALLLDLTAYNLLPATEKEAVLNSLATQNGAAPGVLTAATLKSALGTALVAVKDTVDPTVASAKFDASKNELTVTFSESVVLSGTDTGTIDFTTAGSAGSVAVSAVAAGSTDKELVFTLTSPAAQQFAVGSVINTITLSSATIKDTAIPTAHGAVLTGLTITVK
ncbi:S-layer homology domain-containing protein [Lysinibacillus sp. NPDC094177]|uniref:S-layer homology domain-containing protein n=1 Tax=Lysinibacillus sp. NPDC094177 TaxID=3390580 RepID=UPI003CFD4CD5